MAIDSLTFIHLSDIHFRKGYSDSMFDLDNDVRNQLVHDAINTCNKLGGISGILISGDIAFSGKKEEYDIAINWLENELCPKINLDPSNIWCVPGNHDIDWITIEKYKYLQNFREEIRKCKQEDIEQLMGKYYKDGSAEILYYPLSNYNEFARHYDCELSIDRPFWKHELKFHSGASLLLVGINSALSSDKLDDEFENKLVLAAFQGRISYNEDEYPIVICHHPNFWMKTNDDLVNNWNARAFLQLFGHKHSQQISTIGDKNIILTAGATHPDRREPEWLPIYNFVQIWVENEDGSTKLKTSIFPRRWDNVQQKFVSSNTNDSNFLSFEIKIRNENKKNDLPILDDELISNEIIKVDLKIIEQITVRKIMDSVRLLTYRFYSLSYIQRIAIAQELQLLKNEDENIPEEEKYLRIFQRAKENNLLEKLWEIIETKSGEQIITPNPFSGR
jgi:predicted MPP superfamily phosphohydrolase